MSSFTQKSVFLFLKYFLTILIRKIQQLELILEQAGLDSKRWYMDYNFCLFIIPIVKSIRKHTLYFHFYYFSEFLWTPQIQNLLK